MASKKFSRRKFTREAEEIIKKIPAGKVATYGQVASLAGFPRGARMVGWVLHNGHTSLPWQRVINREGRLSIVHEVLTAELQAKLLRKEGIKVNQKDDSCWIDLDRYLWQPNST